MNKKSLKNISLMLIFLQCVGLTIYLNQNTVYARDDYIDNENIFISPKLDKVSLASSNSDLEDTSIVRDDDKLYQSSLIESFSLDKTQSNSVEEDKYTNYGGMYFVYDEKNSGSLETYNKVYLGNDIKNKYKVIGYTIKIWNPLDLKYYWTQISNDYNGVGFNNGNGFSLKEIKNKKDNYVEFINSMSIETLQSILKEDFPESDWDWITKDSQTIHLVYDAIISISNKDNEPTAIMNPNREIEGYEYYRTYDGNESETFRNPCVLSDKIKDSKEPIVATQTSLFSKIFKSVYADEDTDGIINARNWDNISLANISNLYNQELSINSSSRNISFSSRSSETYMYFDENFYDANSDDMSVVAGIPFLENAQKKIQVQPNHSNWRTWYQSIILFIDPPSNDDSDYDDDSNWTYEVQETAERKYTYEEEDDEGKTHKKTDTAECPYTAKFIISKFRVEVIEGTNLDGSRNDTIHIGNDILGSNSHSSKTLYSYPKEKSKKNRRETYLMPFSSWDWSFYANLRDTTINVYVEEWSIKSLEWDEDEEAPDDGDWKSGEPHVSLDWKDYESELDSDQYTFEESDQYSIDITSPKIENLSPNGHYWTNQPISVDLKVVDNLSGINEGQNSDYSNMNGGPYDDSGFPAHNEFNVTDRSWYQNSQLDIPVQYEGAGPDSTGIYSGVTNYKQKYQNTIEINKNGVYTIQGKYNEKYCVTSSSANNVWSGVEEFAFTDLANNAVKMKSEEYKYDDVLPYLTIFGDDDRDWLDDTLKVKCTVSDDLSGVEKVEYALTRNTDEYTNETKHSVNCMTPETIDHDGKDTTNSFNVTINSNGTWFIHTWVTDRAGNTTYSVSGEYKYFKITDDDVVFKPLSNKDTVLRATRFDVITTIPYLVEDDVDYRCDMLYDAPKWVDDEVTRKVNGEYAVHSGYTGQRTVDYYENGNSEEDGPYDYWAAYVPPYGTKVTKNRQGQKVGDYYYVKIQLDYWDYRFQNARKTHIYNKRITVIPEQIIKTEIIENSK